MKPALFEYVAPATVEEAVAALAADEFARPLAGGQSLIPTLNFRIANPTRLVDLRKIGALRGIRVEGGMVRVGAMTRHRELELDEAAFEANPVIRETLGNVAHIVIRNRGTIGGSIAHADAAAELPALLLAVGGRVVAQGTNGRREIAADDLFQFHMTTTLDHGEIITELLIPAMGAGGGGCFQEFTRRHGDYAMAGVCSFVTLDGSGVCTAAGVAACGVASRAVRMPEVEKALVGSPLDQASLARAGEAARQYVTTPDDVHASTAYRKQLTAALVKRTVQTAARRARGEAA